MIQVSTSNLGLLRCMASIENILNLTQIFNFREYIKQTVTLLTTTKQVKHIAIEQYFIRG